MKKTSMHPPTRLAKQYECLRHQLAQTGYISRGSVMARSASTSGRSGYQWTRKVGGKTVSVSLSPEQFQAMKQAVSNERRLHRIIERMEKLSRQILFQIAADTRRRKPLSKKVLGTL